jgi:hypothetical protein
VGALGVLPVGVGSAARAGADGPIVTALGFVAAAADFCSGLSAAGAAEGQGSSW